MNSWNEFNKTIRILVLISEGGELDIPDPLKEYFTLDEKDKPKNSDPSVFTQHTDQNDELEQSDDTISIDQLAKLASS